jgi:signal peptidase I
MESETQKRVPHSWLWTILIGRKPAFTLIRIVVLVVATFVVFRFILLPPIRITGPSMSPTYRENSIHFVNRLAYSWREPRRGDVVSIRLAGKSIMYMKRIVGLPGETVEFRGGQLFVNGQPLDEPYVRSRSRWEMPPRRLGVEEFFVVGDNRSMPIEDHVFGVATRNRIVGKILL